MVYLVRTKICKNCEIEFSKRMPEKAEFCSVSCRQAYRNHPDRNPSKSIEARKRISESRKGKPTTLGKPCSEKTKKKISKALMGRPTGRRPSQKVIDAFVKAGKKNLLRKSGPSHPMWKGGHSKERHARYKDPEYTEWRTKCLERDGYTCQWCDAKNGMGEKIVLQVHHKIHYWKRPDLRYDIDNGVTLCKSCHQKAHKGMNVPINPTYKGRLRICVVCGMQFRIRRGQKYCPECREKYCCPICGSTKCTHRARMKSKQPLPF